LLQVEGEHYLPQVEEGQYLLQVEGEHYLPQVEEGPVLEA
jgi:hypothetical protein